jgi:hypothetical protein
MCHAKNIMYIIILYVCPFLTYLMLLSLKKTQFSRELFRICTAEKSSAQIVNILGLHSSDSGI